MESFPFKKPQLTREQWVEELERVGNEIQEAFTADRSEWDRLTYFTKTLRLGSEIKSLMEAGFRWFSNTKVADSLDITATKAMYVGSYNSLRSLIETFQDVVDAQIKAEKTEEDPSDAMKYVS